MPLVVILNNLALRRVPDIMNYIGWMFSIIGSIQWMVKQRGREEGGWVWNEQWLSAGRGGENVEDPDNDHSHDDHDIDDDDDDDDDIGYWKWVQVWELAA